jgi:hypothetical protein
MKRLSQGLFLAFLILTFASTNSMGQEAAESPADGEETSPTTGFQIKNDENDPLQKLVEISPFKERYEQCSKIQPAPDIGNCIWNGSPAAGIARLTADEKKVAQQFMETNQETDGRAPADASNETSKKYEGVNVSRFVSNKDPALLKVGEYFSKKLKEALYGELKDAATKQQVQVVDHGTFYDLFENRISKNIVEATSSFCIEAEEIPSVVRDYQTDPAGKPITMFLISEVPATRVSVRTKSIQGLKNQVNAASGEKTNLSFQNWSRCITSLNHMCHGFKYILSSQSSPSKTKQTLTCGTPPSDNIGGCSPRARTYTKGRACAVTNYLKNARQSLIAMTSLKKKWDEKAAASQGTALFETTACKGNSRDEKTGKCLSNLEVKLVSKSRDNDVRPEIDKMTTLTSQEMIDASGFKEEAASIAQEFKKCKDEGDDEVCKKFIAGDKENKIKELAEMDLRSRAIDQKLQGDDFNKDEVEKYLKEQGYSDEQISKLQDPAKIEKLEIEIREKYKQERIGLIANLKEQINETTVKGDLDRTRDSVVLTSIETDLNSRTKRFAELVHFNNIVSGYLEIEDQSGTKTRNTASLYAEINDSSTTVVSEATKESLDQIKTVATEAGVTEPEEGQGGDTSPSLKVDELNDQILDYQNLED